MIIFINFIIFIKFPEYWILVFIFFFLFFIFLFIYLLLLYFFVLYFYFYFLGVAAPLSSYFSLLFKIIVIFSLLSRLRPQNPASQACLLFRSSTWRSSGLSRLRPRKASSQARHFLAPRLDCFYFMRLRCYWVYYWLLPHSNRHHVT